MWSSTQNPGMLYPKLLQVAEHVHSFPAKSRRVKQSPVPGRNEILHSTRTRKHPFSMAFAGEQILHLWKLLFLKVIKIILKLLIEKCIIMYWLQHGIGLMLNDYQFVKISMVEKKNVFQRPFCLHYCTFLWQSNTFYQPKSTWKHFLLIVILIYKYWNIHFHIQVYLFCLMTEVLEVEFRLFTGTISFLLHSISPQL